MSNHFDDVINHDVKLQKSPNDVTDDVMGDEVIMTSYQI